MTKSQNPLSISVLERDDSDHAKLIHVKLGEIIEAQYGPDENKTFFVQAVDDADALIGGAKGYSHLHWLYISHIWVTDQRRSRGLGRDLLDAAEAVAKKRFCVGLYVDTYDLSASRFFEKNGFRVVGRIAGFPVGGERVFLAKRI